MELTGKLIVINPTQQITDTFQKREFVIEKSEAGQNGQVYTDYIKMQFTQNKCDLLDSFVTGQEVTVAFNVKGNKFEKEGKTNYFVNLQAWKIEGTAPAPEEQSIQVDTNTEDLPF